VQKITYFSTKTAATRAALFDFNTVCTKSFLGWGLQCPDPLAVFRGLLLKGWEGRRGDGKGRREEGWRGEEGREGEDMGKDGRRKGEGGSSSFAVGRKKRKVGAYVLELYINHSS